MSTKWPMPIEVDGAAAGATLAYRNRGRVHVTVIVKALFGFEPGAPMTPFRPAPILAHDRFHANDPARSVRQPSDLLPLCERPEILLVGSAYSPTAEPTPVCTVQLVVARAGRTLLNKPLLVQGDRVEGGAPEPFRRMPLVYERAAASPELNPVGIDGSDGRLPNLIDLSTGGPAGYGPIARSWPVRRDRLDDVQRAALDAALPELGDFPPDWFQCAPRDQQLAELSGDEWLTLVGMHPTSPQLKTALPGARAHARIVALQGDAVGQDVAMRLEHVLLDADNQTATLVWRGRAALADARALETLRVEARLEGGGKPASLRDEPEDALITAERVPEQQPKLSHAKTEEMERPITLDAIAPAAAPLPFARATAAQQAARALELAARTAVIDDAPKLGTGTVEGSVEDILGAAATPFDPKKERAPKSKRAPASKRKPQPTAEPAPALNLAETSEAPPSALARRPAIPFAGAPPANKAAPLVAATPFDRPPVEPGSEGADFLGALAAAGKLEPPPEAPRPRKRR